MLGYFMSEENKYKLNDEEIIDQIITLLYSGYETVSTTSMMAVKFLHDHPKVLQQLRVSIKRRIKKDLQLFWVGSFKSVLGFFFLKKSLRFENCRKSIWQSERRKILRTPLIGMILKQWSSLVRYDFLCFYCCFFNSSLMGLKKKDKDSNFTLFCFGIV